MEKSPPKRPRGAYSVFREEMKKDNIIPISHIAKKWKRMTEKEKHPYIMKYKKSKAEHDQFRVSNGMIPQSIEKCTEFDVLDIKRICNSQIITKPMDTKLYEALGRVAEEIVKKLGRKLNSYAEDDIDTNFVVKTINDMEIFKFLNNDDEYKFDLKNLTANSVNEENDD